MCSACVEVDTHKRCIHVCDAHLNAEMHDLHNSAGKAQLIVEMGDNRTHASMSGMVSFALR